MTVVLVGQGVMTLGGFVRRQRGRIGLTQRQLADAIDRDPTWLSRLETNRAKELPGPEEIGALARALQCSEADLLKAAGYLAQNEPVPALTMAEDDIPWEKVPPHVRRMVRGMVDAYFAEEEEPYQT